MDALQILCLFDVPLSALKTLIQYPGVINVTDEALKWQKIKWETGVSFNID